MNWSTKKFHYKIVNEKEETIGYVHKKLSELEEFVNKSKLQVKSLERTGPNDFVVIVSSEKEWYLLWIT